MGSYINLNLPLPPFWSSYILVVFHFGRLPFWSSSILVVFHFCHLQFWSSSFLVVFHFGRLPFWSYPPAQLNGPILPHSLTVLSSRTAQHSPAQLNGLPHSSTVLPSHTAKRRKAH